GPAPAPTLAGSLAARSQRAAHRRPRGDLATVALGDAGNRDHAGSYNERSRPAAQPTLAYARTGKLPIRLTFTGSAEKRKPSAGSCSSPRRCSTIGMPAPSNVVWTGRRPS